MSPTTAANPVPSTHDDPKTAKSKDCCDEGCSAKDCHMVAENKSTVNTVPGTVISSQNMADLDPEASAEPEVVREKAAMEEELCGLIHEHPATSESDSDAKDSESAKLQSHLNREQNVVTAAHEIGAKMQAHPEHITLEDANYLKSCEARAIGQPQPPMESISSDAQRLASANESHTTSHLTPEEQSRQTRESNFQIVAAAVGEKIAHDPEHVTQQDARLVHSREQKAHGHTEKGGISAQAMHLAAHNSIKMTADNEVALEDSTGPLSPKQLAHRSKESDFQNATAELRTKMADHPENITKQDADHIHSLEQKAHGHTEKGGITAQVQHLAAQNSAKAEVDKGATIKTGVEKSAGTINAEQLSHLSKERDFYMAATAIGDKIAHDPEHVTQEDADFIHSREQKAHGHTEKGGITAHAQHLAAENAAKAQARHVEDGLIPQDQHTDANKALASSAAVV